MPLRPLAASILIFIFLVTGVISIQKSMRGPNSTYRIAPPGLTWLGVIDLDSDHGINLQTVTEGEDALLLLNENSPILRHLTQIANPNQPGGKSQLEIADLDSNRDGVINEQDLLFRDLRLIIFNPNKKGYQTKGLEEAGIRGIRVKHSGAGSHQVILSDGSYRTLYDVDQPTNTSFYRTTRLGRVITIENK